MQRYLHDPAWVELQKQVADVLAPFAPALGARRCSHADDWAECEEEDCGYDNTEPKPGSMPVIQDFLVITATSDMNDPVGTQPIQVAIDTFGRPGYMARGLARDFLEG